MTVHDVITLAMGNEYEDKQNDPDAARFSIDVINMLLADAYEAEQYYREIHRMSPLTEIPLVEQMSDEIPYNEGLARIAFVYGVEWKYCEQNLEEDKAVQYRTLYESARDSHGGRYFRRRTNGNS